MPMTSISRAILSKVPPSSRSPSPVIEPQPSRVAFQHLIHSQAWAIAVRQQLQSGFEQQFF